jgi:NAD(P)-dependent dehydrogenase (short-subunit alcohol dehydrogenase family)
MSGRVALITGCGKPDGAGQAIARALAADGVTVVAADRQPRGVLNRRQEVVGAEQPESWAGLQTLVNEIGTSGGNASFVLGDIGSAEDCEAMVATAVQRHGALDILVNNAAAPQGADRALIDEIPVEVIDLVLGVNLRGTFLMCRAAVGRMRPNRWGRIINVSSQAGQIAVARSSPYSASKAGVLGLTRALSMEVAAYGITVNAISPGALGTSRSVLSLDPEVSREHHLARVGSMLPVGRVGTPEDMAAAVRYLVSDGASFMTGQTLVLDGGGPAPFGVPRPSDEGAA